MPTWIFDLDNTLHDARPHIFPHINRSMTAYLQAALGLDEHAAGELRRHYWQRYGATLLGLIKHHGTDPQHFLKATHDFPDMERMVVREPGLRSTLRRLRGRRIVFSNAPTHYAAAVLKVLKVADLFDELYSIEHTRYRPKPDAYGFLLILKRERVSPARCIMVEDTLENLRTAKKIGMKTVWIGRASATPSFVDVRVPSLQSLARRVRRI